MTKTIDEYVKALPEIYQRIWSHPEYDESSRLCEDRAKYIVSIAKSLQEKLGKKNLRVLDLGCAQGYFCFTLAKMGCNVTGIDFCVQNVDLCEALNAESELGCTFKNEKLSMDFITSLPDENYDVVLCLSVIHHVANENGFDYARSVFEELTKKCGIVITELAVKDEPLYWNKNLPASYDEWFRNIAFFEEQAYFPTHLSEINRPLVLFSGKYFYCENQFFDFDSWTKKSYDIKPENEGKRYYFSDALLMKFSRESEVFSEEIFNEVEFLKKNSDITFVPKVQAFEKKDKSTAAVLKINKGKLLLDMLKENAKIDYDSIFRDLLENCLVLEERNFYHGDLRLWNICVKDGRAFLIDFGNIQNASQDVVAKYMNPNLEFSVYDAFMMLVYDVLTGNWKSYESIKYYEAYSLTAFYDFTKLDSKYTAFFRSYLLCCKDKISFKKILEIFHSIVETGSVPSFSQTEKNEINELLLQRCYNVKTDYLTYIKNQRDLSRTNENVIALSKRVSYFDERTVLYQKHFAEQQHQISEQQHKIEELQCQIADFKKQLSEQQEKMTLFEKRLSDQYLQISMFENLLSKEHSLIMNTRHRTLFGAFEWFFKKIFRRKE